MLYSILESVSYFVILFFNWLYGLFIYLLAPRDFFYRCSLVVIRRSNRRDNSPARFIGLSSCSRPDSELNPSGTVSLPRSTSSGTCDGPTGSKKFVHQRSMLVRNRGLSDSINKNTFEGVVSTRLMTLTCLETRCNNFLRRSLC